jgi:hypothetical protein
MDGFFQKHLVKAHGSTKLSVEYHHLSVNMASKVADFITGVEARLMEEKKDKVVDLDVEYTATTTTTKDHTTQKAALIQLCFGHGWSTVPEL